MKKVLLLPASPSLPQKQLEHKIDQIEKELGQDLELTYQLVRQPEAIRSAILDFRPDYLHFLGPTETNSSLSLETNTGEAQSAAPEDLTNILGKDTPFIKGLVLDHCYNPGLAGGLLQYINHVVGIQPSSSQQVDLDFLIYFYHALSIGCTLKDAFQMGKAKLSEPVRLHLHEIEPAIQETPTDAYYMQIAIQLAHQGMKNDDGGPFGAIIVKEGVIIGVGNNRVTSSNDPTAHAEIIAIRAACQQLQTFQLEGCTIYTSCEPCPMCLGAIYWARPERIVYACNRQDAAEIGFDDALIYQELNRPAENRIIPTSKNVLRPVALKVFAEWQAKEDKTDY